MTHQELKALNKEFRSLVTKGLSGSLKKQNEVFNSSPKNKQLFEKAKKLASY